MSTLNSKQTLAFMLGDLRIPACEISSKQWYTILQRVVTWLKPYIKHLPDYSTVAGVINRESVCGVSYTYNTPPERLSLEKGIALDTRFQWIADLVKDEDFHSAILLAYDGRWIYWETEYQRIRDTSKSRECYTCTSLRSSFSWANEAVFTEKVLNCKCRGHKGSLVLTVLRNQLEHLVTARRKQLEGLTLTLANISGVWCRVGN